MTRARSQRGFTLIEVLFAMTFFALVSQAVTLLSVSSMRQTVQNRYGTTAVMVAEQELETLRGLPYDQMTDRSYSRAVDGRSYAVQTAVEDDQPAPGMKRISVRITWTGLEGVRTYDVDTIFTDIRS